MHNAALVCNMKMIRAGIVGVSGYTGVVLARLVTDHPQLQLTYVAANKSAGLPLASVWPGFTGLNEATVEQADPDQMAQSCDVIFLALPHGHAATMAPSLLDHGLLVVDLSADFRLKESAVFAEAYGMEHPTPSLLNKAVYGLVEWARPALREARLIANPGCYPTAVGLSAKPLIGEGALTGPVIANCMSGVSGAGRKHNARNLYCEVAESAVAYGLAGTHRHTPEMEQFLDNPVVFTPHLIPVNRGMLATVQGQLAAGWDQKKLRELYQDVYGHEAMVVFRDEPPSTKDVRGSNRAHLAAAYDAKRGMVTISCAIDNLLKGASGQALQAANVALGLPEQMGLPLAPIFP
jgi:N-acetyl-gamma-glutamyl-phosphate reductase